METVGHLFANAWAVSMAFKHLAVIVMLGTGGWLFTAVRRAGASAAGQGGQGAGVLRSAKLALNAMNLCGTAVAQIQ